MKNIILITAFFSATLLSAQVTIGKGSSAVNDYVSVEFGNATGGTKGIILPWVTSQTAVQNSTEGTTVPGTLIFDTSDQKVKVSIATTAQATTITGWKDLSVGAQAPSPVISAPSGTELAKAKVIIGASSSSANGILVLETPNPSVNPKAMILPRVNKYSDIVNPSAGMIVFTTNNNQLAVFNGKEWSFWKP